MVLFHFFSSSSKAAKMGFGPIRRLASCVMSVEIARQIPGPSELSRKSYGKYGRVVCVAGFKGACLLVGQVLGNGF